MSRIIIKNLPKNISENELREKFKTCGNVTDTKLIFKDGVFRGYGFIGYEDKEQAQVAINTHHQTFIHSLKILVEPAQDYSDPKRHKSWKAHKQEWKEVQQKREDDKNLRIKLANLRRASEDSLKTNELLSKYKDDPKFREYLKFTAGNTNALDKAELKQKEREKEKDKNDNDESGDEAEEEDSNKKAAINQEVSDVNYWASLIAESASTKSSEKEVSDKPSSPSKKKQWKELYTVRLRINKFPKSSAKDKKSKKKVGITKQDARDFFKPLKYKSFRKNSKNRFEYFVGFSTEAIAKQATKKDGSFLFGVKVKVTNLGSGDTTAADPAAAVQHGKGAAPWAEAQARLMRCEPVAESGKIFVRNLSYLVSEEKLREVFTKFGEIAELELPVCKQTRKLKGFATVSFLFPSAALSALNALDGTELMGRLLHILPALPEDEIEQQKAWLSSFKRQKEADQKATAGSWHNWNTLFVSSSAVADIMAKKYNKTKEQILEAEGQQSVAITLALGETQIVDETKRFLEDQGVSIEAFSDPSVTRSDTVLLVKNLPAATKATDIAEMFGKWGELGRVVLPPSGTTAIVEYLSNTEAKKALRNMQYKKFGHAPLYLEKAPVKCFNEEFKKPARVEVYEEEDDENKKRKREDEEPAAKKTQLAEPEAHTTVYVQNLAKDSTEEEIRTHFSTCGEIFTVILAKKGDQFRGYGFVQYILQKDARNALIRLENSTLKGRNLMLKLSEKKLTTTVKTARQMHDYGEAKTAKISVKNLPFQATKVEIEQLFRVFGALKRVFLAKHHTGEFNNGGYGFVEFVNLEDAKRALGALGLSTHIMGRRLVLQWAKEDETVDQLRAKTAHQQVIVDALGGAGQNKKMRHAIWDESEKQKNDEE